MNAIDDAPFVLLFNLEAELSKSVAHPIGLVLEAGYFLDQMQLVRLLRGVDERLD